MTNEEMIEKLKKIGGDARVPIEHVQDIIDMIEALMERTKS